MTGPPLPWPAVAAARQHNPASRLPWVVDGHVAGSVLRSHLQVLQAWPDVLAVRGDAVHLLVPGGDKGEGREGREGARDEALAHINRRLHALGFIVGWRDEPYAVTALGGGPELGPVLAHIERAAARFWGTLTQGAHATGYIADASGQPTHLWIAQRALTKATDPGLLDNLVGGGVPAGQTPWQALLREGWEEAGLGEGQMRRAVPGRVIRLQRDVPEGLQLEDVHSHDLLLPDGCVPCNQDGEVAAFELLPVADALACARSTQMTVDASLVTLDFALRHHLCPAPLGAEDLMRQP